MTDDRTWLVYSREHNGWWRPDGMGYTVHMDQAGRYSLEDAIGYCDTDGLSTHDGPSEFPVPSPEHIESLQKCVEELEEEIKRLQAEIDEHSFTPEPEEGPWS